ncbi:copper homeostasis periplasmic binding protein CopC [Rugamonas sp. CCM 8940]|uniref:copper homeostasis periplasmic binding protein CopC n=1 Tax=Rugamonas sp. CCM 8940 TaxID=2765359 RepID=UPI0018F7AE14|nr:copper homeostasis periplasmic binding protein CopC [Rugamonas sp. CCM 8940]MBJ7312976.1 copper homeostasis periplasmic binding protein CopC [Rugamonas sp. CCM 8940]
MKTLHAMVVAATLAAGALFSSQALAHASLKVSEPPAGATVAAPKEIALTFNEKVEAAFSGITLADGGGKPVAVGKAQVDGANPAILRLGLPLLAPGAYTVSWAAAGRDGHRRKGEFTFTVK